MDFKDFTYGVENSLALYATSYCYLPASGIYDKEALKQYQSVIDTCHVYMVGYLTKCEVVLLEQEGRYIRVDYILGSEKKSGFIPLPEDCDLVSDEHKGYFAENSKGERFSIPEEYFSKFAEENNTFEVCYIGQAYGKNGERNAIDRLLKHETLQKISLSGVPENKTIQLLLLEVSESHSLITQINPHAISTEGDNERIRAGHEKLFTTTDKEKVSLFEASMIRYFSPKFNREFKNSFPSTNLTILNECYDKDFAMLSTEINFDRMPFKIGSEKVESSYTHAVYNDLHKGTDRRSFFSELAETRNTI